jgi:hypothetical protein
MATYFHVTLGYANAKASIDPDVDTNMYVVHEVYSAWIWKAVADAIDVEKILHNRREEPVYTKVDVIR